MKKNRLLSITLDNIKNVKHGRIEFPEYSAITKGDFDDAQAGVIGIYGQNGTGKTTVVDALSLLRELACETKLSAQSGKKSNLDYLVHLDESDGEVIYEFLIYAYDQPFKVLYRLGLNRNPDGFIVFKNEFLQVYPYHETGVAFKHPYAPIEIDFQEQFFASLYDGVQHKNVLAFAPKPGNNPDYKDLLLLSTQKAMSRENNSSFIFSDSFLRYLSNHEKEDVRVVHEVLAQLKHQIKANLFIFSSRHGAALHFNRSLFGGIHYDEKSGMEIHGMFLRCEEPFFIPEDSYGIYEGVIEQINYFVSAFVPNFKLAIDVLNHNVDHNGNKQLLIDVFRIIGKQRLPLSMESAGIKLLVSLSSVLIGVYSDPSVWLVVDELDSGVFENLWGQIVEVIAEEGKGQLLFTAHNLAPLERVSSSCIIFTTANEHNRYIRFRGARKTNNLRDLYLRTLLVGGQEEPLSTEVDEQSIAAALYGASKIALMHSEGKDA